MFFSQAKFQNSVQRVNSAYRFLAVALAPFRSEEDQTCNELVVAQDTRARERAEVFDVVAPLWEEKEWLIELVRCNRKELSARAEVFVRPREPFA